MRYLLLLWLTTALLTCGTPRPGNFSSDDLQITVLGPDLFVHTTYLDIPGAGPVPCNGLIYRSGKQAVVFDTPTTGKVSARLLDWIGQELRAEVSAVIVTHFHEDCLGGLAAFHRQQIPSYAHELTLKLAAEQGYTIPRHGFSDELELEIGGQLVQAYYPGAGHTRDNIVGYIPAREALFGGCLVKAAGSGKGNLADADTTAWPATIRRVQDRFTSLAIVVPGHGRSGGPELLGYTYDLFAD